MSESLLFRKKGNHVDLGTQAVITITTNIIINIIMCFAYLVTDTMIKVTH